MKKNVKGKKLGRDTAHRKALLRNLTVSLIEHGKVETTVSKAKYARPFIEKTVTAAKKGKLRLVKKKLANKNATRKLMDELVARFKNRDGGYTRIVKLGRRDGDNAMMAKIEWSEEAEKEEEKKSKDKKEEEVEKEKTEEEESEEIKEEEKDE